MVRAITNRPYYPRRYKHFIPINKTHCAQGRFLIARNSGNEQSCYSGAKRHIPFPCPKHKQELTGCLGVTFANVSDKAMIRAITNRPYYPRGYKHFIPINKTHCAQGRFLIARNSGNEQSCYSGAKRHIPFPCPKHKQELTGCLGVTFANVSDKAMIRAITNRPYYPRGYKHFIPH